jgi:hypothetical protein
LFVSCCFPVSGKTGNRALFPIISQNNSKESIDYD